MWTYNVACVDAEAAEKRLVTVGAPPLVSEAERLVDVLKLQPHVAASRPAPTNERERVRASPHSHR